MHVINLALHLDQLRLEVGANPIEYRAQSVDGVAIEYSATVFRHKDQVYDCAITRLQAFRYELRTNDQQMRRFAGLCRFVFNSALALQKERHEKKLSYAGMCRQLWSGG